MDGSETWLPLPIYARLLFHWTTWLTIFSLHYSFVTKRGLRICADPQAKWVKTAIKTVDGRSSASKSKAETIPTQAQRSASTAIALSG